MKRSARKAPSTTAKAGLKLARRDERAEKLAAALAAYREAAAEQAATADILRAMSGSSGDPQRVFDAVVEHAHRLSREVFSVLYLYDGKQMNVVADRNVTRKASRLLRSLYPAPPRRDHLVGRTILDGKIYTGVLPDDPRFPGNRNAYSKLMPRRVTLGVPLVANRACIGAIVVARTDLRMYTKKEIRLLQTFANQAVIAIENARLFNETKEALERQTASNEVLGVISSSPTDLKPVFAAILKSALRLCGGHLGLIYLWRGKSYYTVAQHGAKGEFAKWLFERGDVTPAPYTSPVIMLREKRPLHFADLRAYEGYRRRSPAAIKFVDEAGARTYLGVPLLKEGTVLGSIVVYRPEVRPFTPRQIELLQSFASQAVIAMENARLFNETKEALERQTATAEILKVISSSPGDVRPVFDAIVTSAMRLIGGFSAAVSLFDGSAIHLEAFVSMSPTTDEALTNLFPMRLESSGVIGEAVRTRTPTQNADMLNDPGISRAARESSKNRGYRSIVHVPMIRDARVVGLLHVSRTSAGPFSEHHIDLLKTFADQAVIAIENARLFNETKEALERQTATADVLTAISGAQADIAPVFEAIARNVHRLCGAMFCNVLRYDGELVHIAACHGFAPEQLPPLYAKYPVKADDPSVIATRVIRSGTVQHIQDVLTDPHYDRAHAATAGWRRMIGVPMLRDSAPIGAIVGAWRDPGKTPEHQVNLLQTFAAQAVIAIENVRLFKELEARNKDLGESLEQQQASGEILATISASIADAQPVYDKIVESCARLLHGYFVGIGLIKEDGLLHAVSYHGPSREQFQAAFPIPVDENSATGRAIAAREVMHYPDVFGGDNVPSNLRRSAERVGGRSVTVAPMLWEGRGIGGIFLARDFAAPYSEKEIRQLKTFADQAVIAIQNARLFKEIQEKSRELEEASRHKSQFLASMSHELRTPLNAILGFNEMILGGVYGEVPGDMQEPLKDIQTSGRHLLRLINNVLDLAKIEAGRMELALADYSVQDMVEAVRSTLRPLAAEKGLEFVASVPDGIPPAHGDGGRLTQCLMNLAGNSLKFTKQGRVEIGVAQDNGRIRFHVADTGIGIAPEKIATLFTEFKQSDATIASEYGGTGLGLSITKKFVEMHGGCIWVESALGKGSTFLFEVPLRVGA